MKKYEVKAEYWDMWGITNEEDAIIDQNEVERLSAEWETPVENLLEQIEEI